MIADGGGWACAGDEQDYRLLAEHLTEALCLIRDGRFAVVSPAIEQVLGAPARHWVGRAVQEIVPASHHDAFADRARRLASGELIKDRVPAVGADGVTRWVHLHAKPLFGDDMRLDAVAATFRLVDDAELLALSTAEEARRAQQRADERYRRLMENAAVGMCLIAPDGRFIEVNDALCRFFGYDADALASKSWQELTAEDHLANDLRHVTELHRGRSDSYRITKQYIHADGHRIWGDLSVSCIRDEAGAVEVFISQIVDITAEVDARDRLSAELVSAASYMSSIMPGALHGRVRVLSRYLPSRALGGDCFNYTWIDDDHLLVYLIDVSGHGIEPALLAVSLQNMLRSGSVDSQVLSAPDRLITELNRHFQMRQQNQHFFTMWCGVYEASSRTLTYAGAGAPPALVFDYGDDGELTAAELSTTSAPVGMFEDTVFSAHRYAVPPGCQILIYSDGAYELAAREDGGQLGRTAFTALSTRLAGYPGWSLDELIGELMALTPSQLFEDDCSLIQLSFD